VQEIKRELGMTLPTVNIITVLTALNYGALPDMVSLCGDLGCTQLSVREVMLLTDAAHRFLLTDDCRAALPEVVARARDLAAKQGLVSNLDSYYESLTASAESGSAPTAASATGKLIEAPCFSPWHTLMVYPSGRISPCCVLWEEGADSVRTMSLREVWMGAYLQGVRDRIQNSGLLPACANCPPEFILDNAAIREKLAWTARERAHSSLTPLGIARKVLTNLRRHGVGESLRRGKTWMKLQLELRTRRRGSR
jgi:MoaA/NifB/PqqE/SkfB family radical SAM enzyme